MQQIVVGNVPIVFPKALGYLMNLGWNVQISGKQICDFKVVQLLLDARDWQDLPDMVVYRSDIKQWKTYCFTESVDIHQGEFNKFRYDITYFDRTNQNANKLVNLVNMYGYSKQWISPSVFLHPDQSGGCYITRAAQ